jgi:hypothetical protein
MKSFRLLFACAAGLSLAACVMDPPGPSPIYSRLPSAQDHAPQQLSKEEQERYSQIDRQVMAEQQQSMAAEAAAQAYGPYYYPVPVAVGGYYGGGWGNGWGNGWGSGIGISVGTGYRW